MGDAEPFPALLHYQVGTIAAGKLRYSKVDDCRVGSALSASVKVFAQGELIDMIINGIHPRLFNKLVEDFELWIPNTGKVRKGARKTKSELAIRLDKGRASFTKYLRDEIAQAYDQPFMTAVSGLPRQELAKMAEALVSLTVFRMRMSVEQKETVAEPIDVAVLSKGDGFIWVKHKELTRSSAA